MRVTQFVPHPALQPVFKKYFTQQGNVEQPVMNHLAAKGCGAVMIPFGMPVRSWVQSAGFHNDGVISRPTLCGNTSLSYQAGYDPGTLNILYLIFQPTGVWHFARHEASSFSNRFCFVEGMDGWFCLAEMQERLWGEYDPAVVVQLVEKYLLRVVTKRLLAWSSDINPIAAHIYRMRGKVEIAELGRKFRWSTRWLEKQFQDQIGMSPKLYARVARFQSVAQRLLQRPQTGWMQLVAEFGYTDQSHLIKDFLRFSGQVPGHFFHADQQIDRSLMQGMH